MILLSLLILLSFSSGIYDVEANGKTVPVMTLSEPPYNVQIRVAPDTLSVGNVHMSLVVTRLDDNEDVNNAIVTVAGESQAPDILTIGPFQTSQTPPLLNWYDLTMILPTPGEWAFVANIQEGDSATEFAFNLSVQEGSLDWGLIVVFISAMPLLISIAWYARSLKRRNVARF